MKQIIFIIIFTASSIFLACFLEEQFYNERCVIPMAENNSYDIEFCAKRNKQFSQLK